MATPKEIKGRISSVKNIKKITETMEKISTAKMSKNLTRVLSSREYYQSLIKLLSHAIPFIQEEGGEVDHPLIEEHSKVEKSLIITVTSNRGLCGGYNNNVLVKAGMLNKELINDNKSSLINAIGKKSVNYFKYNQVEIEKAILDIDDNVTYDRMAEMADELAEKYINKEVNEIYITYTKFYSQAVQKAGIEKILPFEFELDDEEKDKDVRANYIFEPDVNEVLNYILPLALKVKLFNIILEANLSEQIARKMAMKQASDSAGDIVKDLNLEYNRARQNKITNELIDIIGAANAMK